jgi:hypothetical protein
MEQNKETSCNFFKCWGGGGDGGGDLDNAQYKPVWIVTMNPPVQQIYPNKMKTNKKQSIIINMSYNYPSIYLSICHLCICPSLSIHPSIYVIMFIFVHTFLFGFMPFKVTSCCSL